MLGATSSMRCALAPLHRLTVLEMVCHGAILKKRALTEMGIIYLTVDHVLELHEQVLTLGGPQGLRSAHLLASAVFPGAAKRVQRRRVPDDRAGR